MVSFIFFHTLCLHHHEGRSHHWWPTAPLTSLQKPADVCKMIGLCSSDEGQQEKLLQYLVQEAVQSAATAESVSLTGRTSNGSFVWFNVSDLMSSTVNRVSPRPTAPSASSWSRLWISSSPKTGLRSVAAMSRNPNSHRRKIPSFIPSSFFFSLCRRPWSTCWRRSAGLCPPPTGNSASQWSVRSARRYWTPSWATPRRRPSAPSYISAEGRGVLLKVSRQ